MCSTTLAIDNISHTAERSQSQHSLGLFRNHQEMHHKPFHNPGKTKQNMHKCGVDEKEKETSIADLTFRNIRAAPSRYQAFGQSGRFILQV